MLFDRFVITHLDLTADCGLVRQTVASNGDPLTMPIGFVISRVAQAYISDDLSYGIRIPDKSVKDRVPVIGEKLVGVIAADSGTMAFDSNGNPFLRNWAYADQYDSIQTSSSLEPHGDYDYPDDEYEPYDDHPDEEDDCVSTGEVYDRAYRVFGSAELAREATQMYPGDFI